MKRDRFLAEEIMCEIYWEPDKPNDLIALYQYGFPGSAGCNVLVKYLIEIGFIVIIPHFPGTFDSGDEFTPVKTVSFYEKIVNTIKQGEVTGLKKNKKIKIPPQIECVFGHSYGCWSVLRGIEFFKDVKNVYLFAPAITYAEYKYETNCGLIENGEEHINMVIRTRPYTYRLKNKNAFESLYRGDYDVFFTSNDSVIRIIGIVGMEDSYFDLLKLRDKFHIIIDSSFENKTDNQLIEIKYGTHSLESLLNEKIKNLILNEKKSLNSQRH